MIKNNNYLTKTDNNKSSSLLEELNNIKNSFQSVSISAVDERGPVKSAPWFTVQNLESFKGISVSAAR